MEINLTNRVDQPDGADLYDYATEVIIVFKINLKQNSSYLIYQIIIKSYTVVTIFDNSYDRIGIFHFVEYKVILVYTYATGDSLS